MPTNLPGAADTFTTIPAGTKQNEVVGSRTHRNFHDDLGDAIEAIIDMIGVGASNSSPTANTVRRGTGTGTADWGQVVTAMLAAGAVSQAAAQTLSGGDATTTSTTVADAGPSVTLTVNGTASIVVVLLVAMINNDVAAKRTSIAVRADSGSAQRVTFSLAAPTYAFAATFGLFTGLSAGSHTFKSMMFTDSGGTARMAQGNAHLLALELKV